MCMGPSDPHPNWHLGMRGTQHRAVMWRVWKEGGTGFLYWGANCYEKATVPSAEVIFQSTSSVFFYNPSLDPRRMVISFFRLDLGVASLQATESYITQVKCSHHRRNLSPLYDSRGF